MNGNRSALQLIFAMVALGLAPFAVLGQAPSRNSAQAAAGATAVHLAPYTTPDQSATAGVPPGWKVTKGLSGMIQMSGPQGETISLGNGVFVRNGAFQAGQQAKGPISMSMPYEATLNQKYVMLWHQAVAARGGPPPQVNFISATPIPLPKTIGECAIYLGTMTTARGSSKFESRFCSLPLDSGGIFKLFWMNAEVPSALAAQERATAEAVLASYKAAPATLKLILQPLTPVARSVPSGGGIGSSSAMYAERTATQTATCIDEAVIRQEPASELPSYCH